LFSQDDLEKIKAALAKLDQKKGGKNNKAKKCLPDPPPCLPEKDEPNCVNLTPAQLLIIAGFLTGVLEVFSVTVDKDQNIQILLEGSLKQKTPLEEVMEQVGRLPFEEVIQAIIDSSV